MDPVKPTNGDGAVPPWLGYDVGSKTGTGDTIKEILHRSNKSFIFIDQDERLQWEFDNEIAVDGDASISQAIDLLAQLNDIGFKGKQRRRVLSLIGAALSRAFDERMPGSATDFFKDARDLLFNHRSETLQIVYVASAFVATAIFSAVGFIGGYLAGNAIIQSFFYAASLGSIGALISLSERFREIPITKYTSQTYTVFGGAARIFFGALFGIIMVLLQRGGLVLTVIQDNSFATASLAFVAGFSERLIPELLGNIERRIVVGGKADSI